MTPIEGKLNRGDWFLLAAALMTAEWAYHLAGLQFDASWLEWAWQYLDPVILRRDLLRGVFHLHAQPPAFNLFVGAVLKLAGRRAPEAFHALFVLCGFVLAGGLFTLMQHLGITRRLALIAATLFAISPATVALEHVLFYELPVATLVVWAGVCASRFADRPSYLRAVAFSSLLAALCLTRSLFHLAYFVAAIFAVTALNARPTRATILRAAIVPLALVCALYIKNEVMFGFFGASSWLGMSLARMTVPFATDATIRRLSVDGRLSPIASTEPFSPLWMYPAEYRIVPPFVTHPALTAPRKSTGYVNYNHIAYVSLSRDYFADAITVALAEPSAYGTAIARAWMFYFRSATDANVSEGNLSPITRWIGWWDSLVYLRWPGTHIFLSLIIGLPIAAAYAAVQSTKHLGWAFVALTICYVAVIGNATEVGENNRFRFTTDALSVAAIAAAGQAAARRMRNPPSQGNIQPSAYPSAS